MAEPATVFYLIYHLKVLIFFYRSFNIINENVGS